MTIGSTEPYDKGKGKARLLDIRLPNEIISLILSHVPCLYECALVNKQFHALTIPLLWKVIHWKDEHFSSIPTPRLATLAPHIHELDLTRSRWTTDILARLLPHCPHLQRLTMWQPFCQPTDDPPIQLHWLPSHLTTLQLYDTYLTESSFMLIGTCQHLVAFEWSVSERQDPDWITYLRPLLRRLWMQIDSDHTFTTKAMTAILAMMNLTHLELDLWDGAALTLGTWPDLTHLRLGSCEAIQEDTLVAFLDSHPQLQDVTLELGVQWTDKCLHAIAGLSQLRRLVLVANRYMTSDGVRSVIQACPDLEYLSMGTNPFISRERLGITCLGAIQLEQHDMDRLRQIMAEEKKVKKNK